MSNERPSVGVKDRAEFYDAAIMLGNYAFHNPQKITYEMRCAMNIYMVMACLRPY